MATSEARALPYFIDLLGRPLESGKIYIGQAGLDPMVYPQTVYSDVANTAVLAQPIRTTHGHAVSGGAQVHLYCTTPYSITVQDAAGRVVYTSLNESDPSSVAISTSYVQSVNTLAALRALSGSETNQIWVNGYGLYVFNAGDTTSPESIPTVIVGNDGSRYNLSPQYVLGPYFHANNQASPTSQGAFYSWNDGGGDGAGYATVNKGNGTGGYVIRTVSDDGSTELGRVTISAVGAIAAGNYISANGEIRAVGNLISQAGMVALTEDGTRGLSYDGSSYSLPGAGLLINGSGAISSASLGGAIAAIEQAQAVGAHTLNTGATPTPGTWYVIANGVGSTGVALWVRIA